MRVEPCQKSFRLAEDMSFLGEVVPKGYITNGANIPRVLWCFYPPFNPKYIKAIVLHDYLCDLADGSLGVKRTSEKEGYEYADLKLKEGLLSLGASSFTASLFYLGCRAWHRVKVWGKSLWG